MKFTLQHQGWGTDAWDDGTFTWNAFWEIRKATLGIRKRTRDDNIKTDLQSIRWEDVNWIHLSRDMVQWGALSNNVWTFVFCKRRGTSWRAEWLSVSWKGAWSENVVSDSLTFWTICRRCERLSNYRQKCIDRSPMWPILFKFCTHFSSLPRMPRVSWECSTYVICLKVSNVILLFAITVHRLLLFLQATAGPRKHLEAFTLETVSVTVDVNCDDKH